EGVYGALLGHEIVEKQGGSAWLVLDAALRRRAFRECLFGRLWAFQSVPALIAMLTARKARSLAALATAIGADAAALAAAAEGRLGAGPYSAIDISIDQPAMPMATITLGGLAVNEADGHVIDPAGRDIAGLFAAGRCAIGLASSHYVSGLSLADCVFSGRRAGRAAAAGLP
uniref:FAD-binding protein n=1 Tax=Pelomonas sp. KK5 TaxID=1855730 RepID=UPI001180DC72